MTRISRNSTEKEGVNLNIRFSVARLNISFIACKIGFQRLEKREKCFCKKKVEACIKNHNWYLFLKGRE